MTLLVGDCLAIMPTLDAESIDAIVTDPPYGLEFMGKGWDHGVPGEPFWREALRVAKPGAHLLAFGGTRTYHRLACAIEDAGWEVRDCLVWAYASGFPKSHNLTGDRKGWGTALKPAWEPIILARKPLRGTVAANVTEYGTGALNIDGCRIPFESSSDAAAAAAAAVGYARSMELGTMSEPTSLPTNYAKPPYLPDELAGRWPANLLLTDPIFDGDVEGVVGGGMQSGGGNPTNRYAQNGNGVTMNGGWATGPTGQVPVDTEGTYSRFFQLQEGDGCYLCGRARSADESSSPRRPSAASAPDRALTGAPRDSATTTDSPTTSGTATPFWPDADASMPSTPRSRPRGTSPASERQSSRVKSSDANGTATGTTTTTGDRWTCATCADLITSDSTSVYHAPGDTRFLLIPKASRADREPVVGGLEMRPARIGNHGNPTTRADMGTDRPRANTHPTVKPVALMRHLVRLVTPPGGVVLDPFLGSGTTALACEMEGFSWVGIEKEAEYVTIAEARLALVQRGLGLDDGRPPRTPDEPLPPRPASGVPDLPGGGSPASAEVLP